MKKEDKDILLDFFTKGLTEEEKQQFLAKASQDPEFVKEFIKMSELNSAFEENFGERKETSKKRKPGKGIRNLIIYAGAAAVLLLGLFLGINRTISERNQGLTLFEKYYEPFDITLTRSAVSSNSYLYLYSLYVSKNYQTIAEIDLDILEMDDIKDMAIIMQGISFIEIEDFSAAEALLGKVAEESRYYDFARWYKVLLKLQNNEFNGVEEELNYFATMNLVFMSKAESLLKELKKKKLIN
jgi:hypothetical protein